MIIATTTAKASAENASFTKNPGTIQEANITQKAETNKVDKPNVKIVRGKVRINKKGRTKVLISPNAKATPKAFLKFERRIPGKRLAVIKIAMLFTINETIFFI